MLRKACRGLWEQEIFYFLICNYKNTGVQLIFLIYINLFTLFYRYDIFYNKVNLESTS